MMQEGYPLVSIIIPTYRRPEYFEQALKSALSQTYPNIEIFITDNSPDERTANIVYAKYIHDKRIHYEHHSKYTSADNWRNARKYNNPQAEYVQWLMDDDLLLPDKIYKMVKIYQDNPSVTLVTSYRKIIDKFGNELPDQAINNPIVAADTIFSGKEIGRAILTEMFNFIGEPTTVLIKKKYLHNNDLGWTGKEGDVLISDFPTWLNLCEQGDVVYLREPCSLFRIHGGNQQNNVEVIFTGLICWAMMMMNAWKKKVFLETSAQLNTAVLKWIRDTAFYMKIAAQQNQTPSKDKMLRQYMGYMSELLMEVREYNK